MAEYQQTYRRLRRNHSNALPRYIISYYVETRVDETNSDEKRQFNTFDKGYAFSARYRDGQLSSIKEHAIFSPSDLWSLVKRTTAKNYTTWLISHNTLNAMIISGMPDLFERGELTIEWPRSDRVKENNVEDNPHASTICIIDNPPTIIAAKYVSSGGRLVILDLLNWFRTGLPTLVDKLHNHAPESRLNHIEFPERLSSCRDSASVILRTFGELIGWVKANDMGMFRYTGPSQAMSAYRHGCMTHALFIHDNTEVKQIERNAYYGGRTEVFKLGSTQGFVTQLDTNSLFPSVMRQHNYPTKLTRYSLSSVYGLPPTDIDYFASVASVEIDTDEAIYPVRVGANTVYPIGRFCTTLCGEELHDAYSKGRVKKVASWAEYELQPIFIEWVDKLWGMRQQYRRDGNTLYEEFAKKLLNSLYGKFGQRSPNWINVPRGVADLPWSQWTSINTATGKRVVYRSFGWQVQEYHDKGEIEGTFVAVAAFITAAARVRMNNLRQIAGEKSVLYQGVDSLLIRSEALSRLIEAGEVSATELGKLRIQLEASDCEIHGHSDYRLGEKVVISGLAGDNWTGADGETQQRIIGTTRNLFSGVAIDSIEEYSTAWRRITKYKKGVADQDGWVSPLSMIEPDSGSTGGVSDAC